VPTGMLTGIQAWLDVCPGDWHDRCQLESPASTRRSHTAAPSCLTRRAARFVLRCFGLRPGCRRPHEHSLCFCFPAARCHPPQIGHLHRERVAGSGTSVTIAQSHESCLRPMLPIESPDPIGIEGSTAWASPSVLVNLVLTFTGRASFSSGDPEKSGDGCCLWTCGSADALRLNRGRIALANQLPRCRMLRAAFEISQTSCGQQSTYLSIVKPTLSCLAIRARCVRGITAFST
jgi:hypothetical protein